MEFIKFTMIGEICRVYDVCDDVCSYIHDVYNDVFTMNRRFIHINQKMFDGDEMECDPLFNIFMFASCIRTTDNYTFEAAIDDYYGSKTYNIVKVHPYYTLLCDYSLKEIYLVGFDKIRLFYVEDNSCSVDVYDSANKPLVDICAPISVYDLMKVYKKIERYDTSIELSHLYRIGVDNILQLDKYDLYVELNNAYYNNGINELSRDKNHLANVSSNTRNYVVCVIFDIY